MTPDPTPEPPSPSLLTELDEVRDTVAGHFGVLPMPRAGLRTGDEWAPLDDLRHLTLAVAATTRGFRIPAEELDARFGTPDAPGRTRDELGRIAADGLRAGGRASPPITPSALDSAEADDTTRDRCVEEWRAACDAFREAVARWPAQELDRHRFPHPFLGLFTLREWTHFHVLHARHHVKTSTRRLARLGDQGR